MSRTTALFLAANPPGTSRLELDEEIREISEKIRGTRFRDSLQLVSRWALRPDDLLQSLLEVRPDIVHFSAHSSRDVGLILASERGRTTAIDRESLAAVFRLFREQVKLVVLNACHSRELAESLASHIPCTVGTSSALSDNAARIFSGSFYRALGFALPVRQAFEHGQTALLLRGIETKDGALEIYHRSDVDPSKLHLAESPDELPSIESLATLAICGSTTHEAPPLELIDALVVELAAMLSERPLRVIHGPRGVGIRVVNTMHNRFQRRELPHQLVFVERERLVGPADFVLVVGGSTMTTTEVSIAVRLQKKILPLPATGGAAEHCYDRLRRCPELYRHWLQEDRFIALGQAATAASIRQVLESILYPRAFSLDVGAAPGHTPT